jgi:hypothetical protein
MKESLKLLVLGKQCIHFKLALHFGRDEGELGPRVCNKMCFVCNGRLSADYKQRIHVQSLKRALVAMFNGELFVDLQKLPSLLVKNHEAIGIWAPKRLKSGVVVFLVMQLLAADLLATKKVADNDTTVWVKLATEEARDQSTLTPIGNLFS